MLAKSTSQMFGAICRRVGSEHPYDNPEILSVPVTAAAPAYAAWLRGSLDDDGD